MKYLKPSFSIGGASESFDEGYERVFGKRRERNQGKRYVYREVAPGQVESFEVGEEWLPTNRNEGRRSEEEVFGKLQALDGTDISTRKRHREYMRANGLTLAGDYDAPGGHWDKAAERRAEAFTRGPDSKTRRESIEKAIYQLTEGKRKRR